MTHDVIIDRLSKFIDTNGSIKVKLEQKLMVKRLREMIRK